MTSKLDLDEILGDSVHVSAHYYQYRGDRRNMTRAHRSMEDMYLTLRAEVSLRNDDPRLPEVARALAETLARFGL